MALAQALPQVLKELDPVERAKRDAQLAYYNYLKQNPTGTKPMTAYQKAMYGLALNRAKVANQKQNILSGFWQPYEQALHHGSNDNATSPATPPPPVTANPATPPVQSSGIMSSPSLSLAPNDYLNLQSAPLEGIDMPPEYDDQSYAG